MIDFITNTIAKFFGKKSDRDVKEILPIVAQINSYYEQLRNISNDELRLKSSQFKQDIQNHIEPEENQIAALKSQLTTLDDSRIHEQEKLYEENLELKQKNNSLNDENLRLKTKLYQIEKELNRKEENKSPPIRGLKK